MRQTDSCSTSVRSSLTNLPTVTNPEHQRARRSVDSSNEALLGSRGRDLVVAIQTALAWCGQSIWSLHARARQRHKGIRGLGGHCKAVLDSRGLARAAPGDGEGLCTAQCRISDTGRAPQLAGISTTDADLVAAAGHKQAKLDGLGEQFQINWPLKGFNLLYYLSGRFLHHLLTLLTFLSWLFLMQSVPHLASPKVVMVNVDSLA